MMEVYGTHTYSNISHTDDGGLYVESVIFARSYNNMLPELPHINAMELINDEKTWEGAYDDVIGSRLEVCRTILPHHLDEAMNILVVCPDTFAEWVDDYGKPV